jgi:hypothetical protein
MAIAVKPKPRLDALRINKPQTHYCFCVGKMPDSSEPFTVND